MQHLHRLVFSFVGLTIIFCFSNVSFAQDTDYLGTNELKDVFACRDEPDSLKRLACYDDAVGRFEKAQEEGDIVTISKKQVEAVEKDSFGFNLPSLPNLGKLFKKKDNALTNPVQNERLAEQVQTTEEPRTTTSVKEIEALISKTQTFGYNKTRFFLENGQVWEQTDSVKVRVPKARNNIKNKVNIEKAALGSFLLRVNDKGKAIRVRRVR